MMMVWVFVSSFCLAGLCFFAVAVFVPSFRLFAEEA